MIWRVVNGKECLKLVEQREGQDLEATASSLGMDIHFPWTLFFFFFSHL